MVQPLGSETMEEKHVSHMGSKTMAGTQHDSHMGSQSMEKQPTGSKHSCCKVSSAATGLCGLATLEPSLLGLRRGLGHGLLGLALALVGLAIALLLLGLALGSWLLGCSLGLGLLELVLEPVLMEHGPTLAQGIPPHSWQVALLATLRMNTQLADIPQQQGLDLVLIWLGWLDWQLASSWAWLLVLRHTVGLGLGCRREEMHLNHMV